MIIYNMIECEKYIKIGVVKKMYKRVLLKLSGEALAGDKKQELMQMW